jgi:hypothetical protein
MRCFWDYIAGDSRQISRFRASPSFRIQSSWVRRRRKEPPAAASACRTEGTNGSAAGALMEPAATTDLLDCLFYRSDNRSPRVDGCVVATSAHERLRTCFEYAALGPRHEAWRGASPLILPRRRPGAAAATEHHQERPQRDCQS